MTVKKTKNILTEIKKLAPQLFPILTPQHRAILHLYDQRELRLVNGRYKHTRLSKKAMAEGLGIKFSTLTRGVAFLRRHGFLKNLGMEQYQDSMDSQVKERF